jgi:phosphatidylglycerophosphate synthase
MNVVPASPPWIAPVPNLLTGLRIALALVLPLVRPEARLGVVLAAGLSDFLDGWIARRFHATSALGQLLDGVADKVFVLATVITLAVAGDMPWWQGLAVMARDAMVGGIALWCAATRRWGAFTRMRPRWAGKATTALAFPWFLSLLVPAAESARLPLFLLAALASAIAAIDYLVQFALALRGGARPPRPAGSGPRG